MTGFVTFLGWRLYRHPARRPRGRGLIRPARIGRKWWWLGIGDHACELFQLDVERLR